MKREQEGAGHSRVRDASLKIFGRAARGRIASWQFRGVLCGCRFRSTEGTLGSSWQASQIPLCLPHARRHHLAETWHLSEVQNETG